MKKNENCNDGTRHNFSEGGERDALAQCSLYFLFFCVLDRTHSSGRAELSPNDKAILEVRESAPRSFHERFYSPV